MEIAALVCNKTLNYQSALQIYSIFAYSKKRGNQIQVIDYNFLNSSGNYLLPQNKKNSNLYNFLNNNVILTSIRYKALEQIEQNPPLADKFIIANADYKELENLDLGNNCTAYGIRTIEKDQIKTLKNKYSDISTLFNTNMDDVKKVLDPIFLLSKEEWIEFSLKSKLNLKNNNYILIYGNIITEDMLTYAKNLSNVNSFKVYIVADKVNSIFYKGKKLRNVLPFDLVNLIANAQEVITSCEDGIELSIIFKKNLHIFTNESETDNYMIEIINEFKLLDRVVKSSDRINENNIDYGNSSYIIDSLNENVQSLL